MTREMRLRIAESNWGRDYGWYVEASGKRVAVLSDCVWDSLGQFWFVYKVGPLTDDPEVLRMLSTAEFWYRSDVIYRNREIDSIVSQVIAVLQPSGSVRV